MTICINPTDKYIHLNRSKEWKGIGISSYLNKQDDPDYWFISLGYWTILYTSLPF